MAERDPARRTARGHDPAASGGPCTRHTTDRGQLSLPVVEAAVGVTLILAVAVTLAAGVPAADTRTPQLEAYADDAATVLAGEPPRHRGATRLSEVTRSASAFERERTALDRRVDRILPDNLLYRVETPHGAVGFQRPADVLVGRATVTSLDGPVTVEVWYA
jgi:hypothetical protein